MTTDTGYENKVYKVRVQRDASNAEFQDILDLLHQSTPRTCILLDYEPCGIYRWLDVVCSYNSLYKLQHEYYGGEIMEDFVLINDHPPPY